MKVTCNIDDIEKNRFDVFCRVVKALMAAGAESKIISDYVREQSGRSFSNFFKVTTKYLDMYDIEYGTKFKYMTFIDIPRGKK